MGSPSRSPTPTAPNSPTRLLHPVGRAPRSFRPPASVGTVARSLLWRPVPQKATPLPGRTAPRLTPAGRNPCTLSYLSMNAFLRPFGPPAQILVAADLLDPPMPPTTWQAAASSISRTPNAGSARGLSTTPDGAQHRPLNRLPRRPTDPTVPLPSECCHAPAMFRPACHARPPM